MQIMKNNPVYRGNVYKHFGFEDKGPIAGMTYISPRGKSVRYVADHFTWRDEGGREFWICAYTPRAFLKTQGDPASEFNLLKYVTKELDIEHFRLELSCFTLKLKDVLERLKKNACGEEYHCHRLDETVIGLGRSEEECAVTLHVDEVKQYAEIHIDMSGPILGESYYLLTALSELFTESFSA